MINIPMRTTYPVDSNSISSINARIQGSLTSQNILSVNTQARQPIASYQSIPSAMANTPFPAPSARVSESIISNISVPNFNNAAQKGQKLTLGTNFCQIKACFGWNITNSQCDIDVSAFLLGDNGKVLGDDWFVFYGQTDSPDQSTHFDNNCSSCRETISINLSKLNPAVKKIVFVLTINEAFEKNLNFGMVKDAYIQILNEHNQEMASFLMTEYYSNVISMMIGEVYQYNGTWKFNAIGNGVIKDLAGLCELYGVEIC